MAVEPDSNLLHYRIVEKLGEGGMGVVWKAVDTTLDREVAIKVLPPTFAESAERLARFEREAKLLASFSHPGIAAVYGLHEAGGSAGPARQGSIRTHGTGSVPKILQESPVLRKQTATGCRKLLSRE
jgi:serine/threonine protein kinase